jgi:hypothetical protein
LEVPTMRAIAALERVEPELGAARHAAWGLRGRVRLLGSICLLAALALAAYVTWLASSGAQAAPSQQNRPAAEEIAHRLNAATPMETLQLWENLLRGPMVDPRPAPQSRRQDQQRAMQRSLLGIAMVAGFLGLLMLGGSFFLPQQPRR